ncbi:hypothetical protein ACFV1N_44295 [Streptosporangium canum]
MNSVETVLGAILGAKGLYGPGPTWTDMNERILHDLRGELV